MHFTSLPHVKILANLPRIVCLVNIFLPVMENPACNWRHTFFQKQIVYTLHSILEGQKFVFNLGLFLPFFKSFSSLLSLTFFCKFKNIVLSIPLWCTNWQLTINFLTGGKLEQPSRQKVLSNHGLFIVRNINFLLSFAATAIECLPPQSKTYLC